MMSNDSNTDQCFTDDDQTLESYQKCVREQALSHMRYMSFTQAAVFTFAYTLISVIGILGNGLVIFVVVTRPKMRTNRNVFIVNLALSNFILAIILVPFLWTPTYRIEFPYGEFMCKVAQAFPGANIFCSTLTVSVIAVDRYYAIVRTKLGPGRMKTMQATSISIGIWILSCLLSILYFLHFRISDYTLPGHFVPAPILNRSSVSFKADNRLLLFQRCELKPATCSDPVQLNESWDNNVESCFKFYEIAVSVIMASLIYVVPMPILVIFSCLLTHFLHRNERQHSVVKRSPKSSRANGDVESCTSTTLIGHQNSIRGKKTSEASQIEKNPRRRRSRTTSLLFAMAFSNAILWLPFTIVSLFIQLSPEYVTKFYQDELRQVDDAAKMISMLSICVNPFLYGYLNTNFKREFKSIFRRCFPWCVGSPSRMTSDRSHVSLAARDKDSSAIGYGIDNVIQENDTSLVARPLTLNGLRRNFV